MPFFKKYIFLLLLFAAAASGRAQTNKTDRLFVQLNNAATPPQRLDAILALCEEYQSLNRDTLYNLAFEARQLADAQPDKNKKGLAAMALSDAYMQWGWADSALAALEPELLHEKDYTPGIYFKMKRHQGMIYAGRADYEKALAVLYPALTGAEKYNDTLNRAAIMNSIGSISLAMVKPADALAWIHNAAALCINKPECKPVLAAVYTNAANVYLANGNTDSVAYYIQQAIPLCRETENLFILATALRINASLLTDKKRFAEAEAALKEMIAIRKITSGEGLFVEDNLKLADFYARSGQLEKAIQLCSNLLNGKIKNADVTYVVTDPKLRLEYWQALAGYYKQANRPGEYQGALEQVVALKDSIYEANYAPAIADAEIKYQSEKKQNTILQQKYSLQRNRVLLYGSLALLAMLLVIAFFTMRDLRRRQKLKMELALANEQIKAEAAVKNAEEKERLRIAADLHDNIGAYASAIRSDVDKITQGNMQDAVDSLNNLQQHSQEIMNSLRDTIWALNKEQITITGISDRVKNYISKLQPSYGHIQFNIEESVTHDIRIHSQAALNIFRIVQEAVHNTLKHSGATELHIKIYSGATAGIIVTDNGSGLNGAVQTGRGNGIRNMQSRAAESGLQLSIHAGVHGGTVVELQVPTTN